MIEKTAEPGSVATPAPVGGGRPGELGWIVGVALLPILFLIASVAAEQIVDEPATRIGKVLALCNFIGIAAQVPLGPLCVVSLCGAIAMGRGKVREGRWFVNVAGSATTLLCFLFAVGVLADAIEPNPFRNEWHPLDSPLGAMIAVSPYLTIGVANVYLLVRLSKRPR